MKKIKDVIIYSASDLVSFLECEHGVALNLKNLETPLPKAGEDEQNRVIIKRGFEHEEACLDRFTSQFPGLVKIEPADATSASSQTLRAMKAGAPIIYQAVFSSGTFTGIADFLRRVESPSSLGAYSYEVVDAKLATTPKAKFVIQLCHYSDLLSEVQGRLPSMMHVLLGNGTKANLRVADYYRYYKSVKRRFLEFVKKREGTYPEQCDHCNLCDWRDLCSEQWLKDDHLNQTANITRIQIKRLNDAGIKTLKQLALVEPARKIPKMADEIFAKLRTQASLQFRKRNTGQDLYELLPLDSKRGLLRVPEPDKGDVFFDMEGDPLEDGGLEYLFGVYYFEKAKPVFKAFWAHNRSEERRAFEFFMDFISERLRIYPGMHIYHYASYEETALKRLMSLHGVRESAVDNLLRKGKLVDLYKVIKESLRVSEPRYSIKNMETFYMEKREAEVKSAGESIVYYENWRTTQDPALLEKIRAYNEDDCRSLYLLRSWLLKLRPQDLAWFNVDPSREEDKEKAELSEAEARLLSYEKKLLAGLPEDRNTWKPEEHLRELVFYLLEFHRRAAKPDWWAMFSRMEQTHEDLMEDIECLGGLSLVSKMYPPQSVGRSLVYTFSYPEQEFKMKAGDDCLRSDTSETFGQIVEIEEQKRLIRIKISAKRGVPPELVSIMPRGPIKDKVLREAIYRFADSLISGSSRYAALKELLMRTQSRIEGFKKGQPIIFDNNALITESIEAITNLKSSYIFIQGPPGTGKTHTGSHIIVELLRKGFRVGVSSNSHKAINNLLNAVEERARDKGFSFHGIKKSTQNNEDSEFSGDFITSVSKKEEIKPSYQLIAGTAWLFAYEEFDEVLDYLFIDEAGQVAVGNLTAMSTSAKNIVLLGDQMQLGQPIKGIHPGHSGHSTLDYLLEGRATVAPDKGIFLSESWRMHEDVCRFISDVVYDSRLEPREENQNQRLVLSSSCHPELRPTGIRFVGVEHDGCSQKSEEEGTVIQLIYEDLLRQEYKDKNGSVRQIKMENILVVAPYNVQVNYLKAILPEGSRVGTVDKFQGQEAEVVIISMTTSNREHMPRNMEFLYNKNRLNVAISRAKCLALLVASPALLAARCTTIDQIELVNTLCWAEEYSKRFD